MNDVQECQVDGHIGKSAKIEASEDEGDETSTRGMAAGQTSDPVGGNGHENSG